MNTLWTKLRASGLVAVCWILGSINLWIIIANTLKVDSGDVITKASYVGVGLVFNTVALVNRRRLWIGLMAPFYTIGILAGLFWLETVPTQVSMMFMAMTILIPITFFSIPSAKRPKLPTT
jgi:hypothetical protein